MRFTTIAGAKGGAWVQHIFFFAGLRRLRVHPYRVLMAGAKECSHSSILKRAGAVRQRTG